MPVDFSGTWTSGGERKSEGWGGIFKALKVDIEKAKTMTVMKATVVISQNGDTIAIVTTTDKNDMKKEVTITVGSNFTDTILGQTIEYTTAWQGDQLVMTGVNGRGSSTREMDGAQMLFTFKFGDAVAKTWFDKQ